MAKQSINQTPEPNALESAEHELATLQAESADIPAALNKAAKDGDTREIMRLRRRSAELHELIPALTVAMYQLQEQHYIQLGKEADTEAVELAILSQAAEEQARAATKEANRLMGELSNLQSEARACRQTASQIASQRSQMLRQMSGQAVDRALRMPLNNPSYGN